MRILLNGVVALKPMTGIGQYIENLQRHLVRTGSAKDVTLFPGQFARKVFKRFAKPSGPRQTAHNQSHLLKAIKERIEVAGAGLLRFGFQSIADRLGCDIYHEPNSIPWPCNLPTVITIHDLSVLQHPEWHPAKRVKHYERHFFDGLKRASHLIADCHAIRREIIANLGVPSERVSTVHLGVREQFRSMPSEEIAPVLQTLGLKTDYLLHVGTIEPRKNLLMLMQAYCDLPSVLRERHALVLAGKWGWQNQQTRDYYFSTARHRGVVHCDYVADDQLPALYNGARALVFPSHYEGFGFPPLEMMACGGAVIASDIGSLREILPADMSLLPSNDLAAWRDGMQQMLTDRDWWNLSKQGAAAHASKYTWDRCARLTRNVYESVLQKKKALAA